MPTNIVDSNSRMLLKLDATQGNRFSNSGRQDSNLSANDFGDALVSQGNPQRIVGVQDDALTFRGSDAIRLADHNNVDLGTSSFAINFQMQTSNRSEIDMILDKRDANGLGYALSNNNGQIQLTLKGTTGQTVVNLNSSQFSSNVTSNDWQNITVNVDRSSSSQVQVQLFVNGVAQSSSPIIQAVALGDLNNTAPLTIGAASAGMTATGLNASLDNVRLLDRMMTPDEINRIARSELTNINPISNRVALWRLDEAAVGMAADSSGQNDLTHINNPSIIQGKVDHAVQLNIASTNPLNDAAKQRLTAADNSSIDLGTSDFTISTWIKSNNVTQLDKILEKVEQISSSSQKGYSLYNDNGRIGLQLMDGTQSVKFELTSQQSAQIINSSNNNWQHLSVSVDRTANAIQEVKFFANGNLITASPQVSINGSALAPMTSSVVMGNIDNSSILSIGSSSMTNPSNFLNAALDEIQIAKSELSQTQIQDLVSPKELLVTNSLVSASRSLVVPNLNEVRDEQLIGLTRTNNISQSDILTAGAGNDVLIGVNPLDVKPGLREIDQLTGGAGADKFVLGDTSKSHYITDNFSAIGNGRGQLDYALIQDFRSTQGDKIELFGKASDYELKVITTGSQTEIYRNLNASVIGGNNDDLVAIVQHDTTALSLTNTAQFTFI